MSLRRAPRFQAYFRHLEGRDVMVMSRRDCEQVNQLREGDITEINLSSMPIADVARDSRMPQPINLDRYQLWERLPPHRDFVAMVNAASTEDNANMRAHQIPSIPNRAVATERATRIDEPPRPATQLRNWLVTITRN